MNLYEKYPIRTDLADEKHEFFQKNYGDDLKGIRVKSYDEDGFSVNITEILDKNGEKIYGKPTGRYVTIDVGRIWFSQKERFNRACGLIGKYLREFIPNGGGSCMLAALGNKSIIADGIGPFCAEGFIVTKHILQANREIFDGLNLRETMCISPGVLGNTGIEAAKIVKGAVQEAKPSFIIAVDSLVSGRLSRLATTIQICDTGITPGSGVNNRRSEISIGTMGVPVIAIGVPTVVDVTTLAVDIVRRATEKSAGKRWSNYGKDIIESITEEMSCENFFVTPKETDHIIKDTAKLLAYSINLALHEGISCGEIDELTML